MKTSLYSTSSWKRQGVALLGIAALLTLCGQSLVYAQLSASDIAAMKQEIAKQKYTFTVDENPATKIPLSQLCGTIPSLAPKSTNSLSSKTMMAETDLPSYWDWRQHNGVTPVKDQGSCGSCWAFSTVGTMEAMILIASGITTDLSEQQLVSCNTNGWGCGGGNYAFDMEISPGAMLESCFAYQAADVACQSSCPHVYQLSSWGYVGNSSSVPSTTAIKNAIYTYGPISVEVAVDYYFQAYSGGVFNHNSASSIDHAVVLVGWDDTNGCWIMKNSWGTGWGESGYMRIAYGCDRIGYGAAYAVWELPDSLLITPATGFSSIGGVGGPFTITSQSLTLTNAGTNSLTWTLANTSVWLNASPSCGTLTPGGVAATVTVSLNTAASNLVVGTYSATLWFTNLNSGVGQGRQFTLAVISPPTITTQPADQAVLEGAMATFTVAATGGQPMYYQWQDNGTNLTDGGNILGSMTTSLIINSVSAANIGTYTVIVTNAAGMAASSNALLTITPSPPVITMQPVNQTVGVDQTAVFTVAAIGSTPMFYQWSFGGTNIVGATDTTLTLTNVQFSQAGTYAVFATNALGSVTSSNAVLTVLPCSPAPSGLVDWWPGEGNANDTVGTNNGTLGGGASYAAGEVGHAFSFDGTSGYVSVPDSPSLDSFTTNMTIELWMKAGQTNANADWKGLVTKGNNSWRLQAVPGAKTVNWAFESVSHFEITCTRNVNDGQWHHVAAIYDGAHMFLYVDGTLDVSQAATGLMAQNTDPVCLGANAKAYVPSCRCNKPGYFFNGLIDEASIYNRALSASEIQAIYAAGPGGKCPPSPTPPSITTQPANQTVFVGSTATFSVTASGTTPLSYQWNFNGTNISGATNTSLTLTNVQLNQAGNYAVLVTNIYGSVLSSNAALMVNPPPSCVPVPSGIVSWWPGEGNANDVIGTNNGTLVGVVSFVAGEVNQAFSFNGSSYVDIPDSAAFHALTNRITIEAWIKVNPFSGQDWIALVSKGDYSWQLRRYGLTRNLSFFTAGLNNNQELQDNRNIDDGQWHHVAGVYDGTNKYIYVDGTLDVSAPATGSIATTSVPLMIGDNPEHTERLFNGLIDEVSIYNRALTALEIQTIYAAGSGGKCPFSAPVIISQPTNQTVNAGGTANFSVMASGTPPLSYQWRLGGINIVGATNATLTLTNVQFNQSGNYSVLVINAYGSILSSNTVLTVTLDHFAWGSIPSPRFVNSPFAITIRAQNLTNGIFTNFIGAVILGTTNGVAVTPSVSGNFVQGVWTGAVVISQMGSNLVLRADDGLGHFGLANPINVIGLPTLNLQHYGNILLISWPVASPGFMLETSGNLAPAFWVPVSNPPIQFGDQYLVLLDRTGTNGFYRLWFPGP